MGMLSTDFGDKKHFFVLNTSEREAEIPISFFN